MLNICYNTAYKFSVNYSSAKMLYNILIYSIEIYILFIGRNFLKILLNYFQKKLTLLGISMC